MAIKLQKLQTDKDTILAYARGKLVSEDFHAVQDAMADIREIVSQMEFIKDLLEVPGDGA